ncbi:MAG: hypothetical protein EOO60_06585 [Hymenobacter sp.]|nr:MAG: hypothetical protein EOO60_06585 [Hymenobacter sp.]
MNGSAFSASFLLPLSSASAPQLTQAITTASRALAPYYPTLTWAQWQQAFIALQLPLRVTGQQVVTTALGLSGLIQYLETQYLPASQSPIPTMPKPQRGIKRTYDMQLEVLESLERVSYWLRKNKSALVNKALLQLLARYPESQIPVPPIEL